MQQNRQTSSVKEVSPLAGHNIMFELPSFTHGPVPSPNVVEPRWALCLSQRSVSPTTSSDACQRGGAVSVNHPKT